MEANVVVVGAGISGVAVAHELSMDSRVGTVVLVDPRPPLTLTSDKSTECYRNWWPNRPMVGIMNRSIDLVEDFSSKSNHSIGLTRRGYLFVTSNPETLKTWESNATKIAGYGAGSVRIHQTSGDYVPARPEGYDQEPDGVDLLIGRETIRTHFPFITDNAVGAMHVRRAGWFSAQQLGSWLLDQAKAHGLIHVTATVDSIVAENDQVSSVVLDTGESIATKSVVNSAGPMAKDVAAMVGVDLPLSSEVHLKVAFRDHRQVIPREAPMVIWSDPQHLGWSPEEREALREAGRSDLLGEMPVFCHGRPEGGVDSPYFLALWEYHDIVQEPSWPLPADDMYPEVVARGLTTMVPAFGTYLDGLPASVVDGGYYTKTPENRPLVGPAGPRGFYLACGYSGFGVMIAAGAADLVRSHITGGPLPEYAPDFLLARYEDPAYVHSVSTGVESGQL